MTSGTSKLQGLEAGRGVAAMLVVGVHTFDHCTSAYGSFPIGSLFAFGHAGVDFFFVLSGFIIYHVHRRDIGTPRALGRYAERRVTRIYPIYWIVTLLTLLALTFSSHAYPSPSSLLTSLVLAPTGDSPVVGIAWTLQHEVLFYVIFGILIANRRIGSAVFLAWFILILFAAAMPGLSLDGSAALLKLAAYFNLEFFMGIAVAMMVNRWRFTRARTVAILAAIAFLCIGLAEDAHLVVGPAFWTHVGYGLAASAVVFGLARAEMQGQLTVPRSLTVIGDASYSIYLTHVLCVGAIWQVLLVVGIAPLLPPVVAFAILVTGGAVGGIVVSRLLEKPSMRMLRRVRLRPAPA